MRFYYGSIMSLTYWICLIQSIPTSEMTLRLRLFQYFTIASVWGFDIAATMSEFQKKGFGGISNSTQLFVSASLIAFISTTFLLYGLEILRRLNVIDRMAMARRSLNGDGILCKEDSETVVMPPDNRSMVQKPSWRICKVLILTETISIVTMAGQVRKETANVCCLRTGC